MKILLTSIILIFLNGCESRDSRVNNSNLADFVRIDLPDSSKGFGGRRDHGSYLYKNRLTEMLSLKRLELGTDSFEVRFWSVGTITDPIILYSLKKPEKGEWTNVHYQIFRGNSWNNDLNPQVDSLVAETVKPRQISWSNYISRLHLDSLWNTPSQCELVDDRFGSFDGYSYYIELADKKRYKFMNYYVPDQMKNEINHKRVLEFQENLRTGIIYKGIINP